jgi:hypothetical protein
MAIATLPRRDEHAREHLELVARRARPVVLAGERLVPVAGHLGALLPGGAVQRGSVIAVDGAPGSGAASVALQLASAATAAGEWVGAVELDPGAAPAAGGLGGLAALEAGVDLDRFAVVRAVPPARWAAVVAALLEGIGMVLAEVPARVRLGDARRLLARAREQDVVLVALSGAGGSWPGEASLRIRAEGSLWREPEWGGGVLGARDLRVRVDGRGAVRHGHAATA